MDGFARPTAEAFSGEVDGSRKENAITQGVGAFFRDPWIMEKCSRPPASRRTELCRHGPIRQEHAVRGLHDGTDHAFIRVMTQDAKAGEASVIRSLVSEIRKDSRGAEDDLLYEGP